MVYMHHTTCAVIAGLLSIPIHKRSDRAKKKKKKENEQSILFVGTLLQVFVPNGKSTQS